MECRLALVVFLVAAFVALGGAQQRPQRPPNATAGTGAGAAPAQGGTAGGGAANANPSLTPPQLVDAQGAPVNCNCLSTQEYNPVCGSNGATYNNPSKLRCAQRCGYEVELNYYGQCPAPRT